MFTLRLLGGATLEGPSGVVTGRAVQRRRMALLALLAAAPGRAMSRDKLVGYLWPDHPIEGARHLLTVALYDLRRALGEDALQSRGEDVVLDAALVRSDADDLLRAAADGDAEAVVALYAGPYLDGVYVDGAPEFERWASTLRDRCAAAHRDALERMADSRAAAGDARGAVEAWRRLAVLDPGSARVAVGYMRALNAVGDRAAALRHAAVHAALLRADYGTEPDAAVSALAARLREGALAGGDAPASPESPPNTSGARATTDSPAPTSSAASTGSSAPVGRTEPSVEAADGIADAASAFPAAAADASASGASAAVPPASPDIRPSASAGDAEETPAAKGTPKRGRRRRPRVRLVGTGAALAITAAAVVMGWRGRSGGTAGEPSVVVLPFASVAGDEYFRDGLTDEIIDALARVDGIRVVARTSAFAFRERDADPREVARALEVDHVLEGTVRRAGDSVRITVHLVRAEDRAVLWSETFDGSMGDVFRLQDRVAGRVVGALRGELAPAAAAGAAPLVRSATADVEAYEMFLRGRHEWRQRTPAGFAAALGFFGRALARDSSYAMAWVGMADVYNTMGAVDYAVLPPSEAYPRARQAAERALALDPASAEAHAALGNVLLNYAGDLPGAERALRRATELNPGYAEAHHWLSIALLVSGRGEEALAAVRRARAVDPVSLPIRTGLARTLYFTRDHAAARDEYRAALRLDSAFPAAHVGLGLVHERLGDLDAAVRAYETADRLAGGAHPLPPALLGHAHGAAGRTALSDAMLARLREMERARYVPPEYRALVHLGAGRRDEALRELAAAHAARSAAVLYLPVEPMVDPLRTEPRFRALLPR